MPSGRNELRNEPGFGKVFGVLSFPELVGAEAVTVRREGLHNGFERVRCVEPRGCVEVLLNGLDLRVDGFGDQQASAVVQIFDKTGCAEHAGCCGD